nr:MAG TPA: hypothetical protein [Caudoviricetes sp.]
MCYKFEQGSHKTTVVFYLIKSLIVPVYCYMQ